MRMTLALAVSILMSLGAEARIVCRDGFQAQKDGGWISTPYCNDEDLAQIARRHGMKVTGAQLRRDWSRREDVCRLVGHSPRARHYCPFHGPDAHGR